MAGIQYTDWDITERHAEIIVRQWPVGLGVKKPEVRKTIPGVKGRRISDQIRSGIWMKPLGSHSGRTYSSVRDIQRSTLMVFVSASTTGQSRDQVNYEKIRDLVRDIFHDRRGTDLNGEVFSRVVTADYDMDDAVTRQYDVDIIEIQSWFREERTNGVC
jgi:hypothetical protein